MRVPNFSVPNINPPFTDTAGICAHPTPENKRKAVEVLAAVFGGESVEKDISNKEKPSDRAFINLS